MRSTEGRIVASYSKHVLLTCNSEEKLSTEVSQVFLNPEPRGSICTLYLLVNPLEEAAATFLLTKICPLGTILANSAIAERN